MISGWVAGFSRLPPQHHEPALMHGRSRIHLFAAIEMILDLGGGTDHATIQEHVERRGFQIFVGQQSRNGHRNPESQRIPRYRDRGAAAA
jgi:hypothetical protein